MTAIPLSLRGRYAAQERLGGGGMGEVWAAHDRLLERDVALKLLRPDRRPDEGRLREEFALLAALDHPGVVTVRDVGMADDIVYLATDRLTGVTLDRWLLSGPESRDKTSVVVDLLATLGWLHGQGIVHADIKPANIIIEASIHGAWPTLIDFGLARDAEDRRLLGGTPKYMAPELMAGAPPSPSTDLYALGVSLQQADLGPTISHVIDRLAHRQPEQRYPNAYAALADLDAAVAPKDAPCQVSPIAPDARRHRLGSQGAATLWDDTADAISDLVASADGIHRVTMPGAGDAPALLNALKGRLELRGCHVLMAPRSLVQAGPRALFSRLADCLVPSDRPSTVRSNAASPRRVEDHKEALDVFVGTLIESLKQHTLEQPWTLLLPYPEDLSKAGTFILARLIESGCVKRAIFAGGATPWILGRGLDDDLRDWVIQPPRRADIDRYLGFHRILLPPPPALASAMIARAALGAAAVRSLLSQWVDVGALEHADGHWDWAPKRMQAALDAPDMDDAWAQRWQALTPEAKQTLVWVAALGGQADRTALMEVGADRHIWAPLEAAGWLSGKARGLALSAGNIRRIREQAWSGSTPTSTMLLAAIPRLQGDQTPSARACLAEHLTTVGRHLDAADVWRALAEHWDAELAPDAAAKAAHHAAQAALAALSPGGAETQAERPGLPEVMALAVSHASYALRQSLTAGDPQGCEEALKCAQAAISRGDTTVTDRSVALDVALLEARAHAFRTRSADALEAAARAEALLDGPSSVDIAPRERAWSRLELMLAKGTALGQKGAHQEAAAALQTASDLAESQLNDDHALGRVANNLGIVYFNLGRFEEAAEAWAKSSQAKANCGDQRGERIASSNQGLALRELGRLADAANKTRTSLALAKTTGDRPGLVMGHLSLAQLWLDVGDVEQARTHLGALAGLSIASRMLRVDIEVVQVRADIAAGVWPAARERADAALKSARTQNLPTVLRELWPLRWLIRYGDPTHDIDHHRADLPAPGADAEALMVSAARACAAAYEGDWDATRQLLDTLLERTRAPAGSHKSTVAARPGEVVGLALALQAAAVVNHREAWSHLADQARVTAGARYAEQVQLASVPPTAEGLVRCATALRLQSAFEGDPLRSPLELARTLLETSGTMTATIHPIRQPSDVPLGTDPTQAVTPSWSALSEVSGKVTSLDTWCKVLAESVGASGCTLVEAGDTLNAAGTSQSQSTPTLLRGVWAVVSDFGDRPSLGRFTPFIKAAIAPASEPWVAQSKGRVEAVVLPLRHTCGELPVGVAVMTFDAPCDVSTVMTALLGLPAQLTALSLDREQLRERLESLATNHARVLAEQAELKSRHHDELTAMKRELEQSRSQLVLRFSYDNIIHQSDGMRRVLRMVDRLSDRDINVLISGESGVGKEVVARALHTNSERANGPFIAENCGAIPPDLFESVFFGHVRGAFTGANRTTEGLFEAADGGTLFLDELGELPLNHQVKLLRVLQERRYRPVGATREREANFRLVAATNRDLPAAIETGAFREDLYYRIAVVTVPIPPLRERRADILPLAKRFIEAHLRAGRRSADLTLTPAAANALVAYDWPGNVRELENEMLRVSVLCDHDAARLSHLSPRILGAASSASERGKNDRAGGPVWDGNESLSDVVSRLERDVITAALTKTGGKKVAAAKLLSLSRPGLDAKLKRYDIDASAIKHAIANNEAPSTHESSHD